jgi:preprotein translocase subunit SecA
VIYQQRTEVMGAVDVANAVAGIRHEVVNNMIDRYIPPKSVEDMWDLEGLSEVLQRDFSVPMDVKGWLEGDKDLSEEKVRERIAAELDSAYETKVATYGAPVVRHLEKAIMLQQLDSHWREHLAAMDYLRQGIHLRSYAQKNPKQEYKREAFELFSTMLDGIKRDVIQTLMNVQIRSDEAVQAAEVSHAPENVQYHHAAYEEALASGGNEDAEHKPFVRGGEKVGRNDPCPCGSGKKYKQCHGKLN